MGWFSSISNWFTSGGRDTFNEKQRREIEEMMQNVRFSSSNEQRENEARFARRINEMMDENARRQRRDIQGIQGQIQQQFEAFEKIKKTHGTELERMEKSVEKKMEQQAQAFDNLHQMHEIKIGKVTKEMEELKERLNKELEEKGKKSKKKSKNDDPKETNNNKHAQELIQLLNDLKNTMNDKDKKPAVAENSFNLNANFPQYPNNNYPPNSNFPQHYPNNYPSNSNFSQHFQNVYPPNPNFSQQPRYPPNSNFQRNPYFPPGPASSYPNDPQGGNLGHNNFRQFTHNPRYPSDSAHHKDTVYKTYTTRRGGRGRGVHVSRDSNPHAAGKKEFPMQDMKNEPRGPKKKQEFPMGNVRKAQRNDKSDNEWDNAVSDTESVSSVTSQMSTATITNNKGQVTLVEFLKHMITGLNGLKDLELQSINIFLNEPSCRCMYRQWGMYLLDILVAGSPYKTQLTLTPEDLLTGLGNLNYDKCLFKQPDTLQWPKHFKEIIKNLGKNYKYLKNEFENSLVNLFLGIHYLDAEKQKKLAQLSAVLFADPLWFRTESLVSLLQNNEAVSNGNAKAFLLEFLLVFKCQRGFVGIKGKMNSTKFVTRWLDFFPQNNRKLEDMETEFKKKGLIDLYGFYRQETRDLNTKNLINLVKDKLKTETNTDNIKSELKKFAISNEISEEQAVIAIWKYLIGLDRITDAQARLLSAFTTNAQSERILVQQVVDYCDKECKPLSFVGFISQFYKAQALSQDVILSWYDNAYYSENYNTLVENIKEFIQWLQSPEDGNTFSCENNNESSIIDTEHLDELNFPTLESAVSNKIDIHSILKIKLVAIGKDKNTGKTTNYFPKTMNDVFEFHRNHDQARLFKMDD